MCKLIFNGEYRSRSFELGTKFNLTSPIFVPSISSRTVKYYNRYLDIVLNFQLPPKIWMLSAYDVKRLDGDYLNKINKFSENFPLYLDSGGFEAQSGNSWTVQDLAGVSYKTNFEILVAFDKIVLNNEGGNIKEMKENLLKTSELIEDNKKTLTFVLHKGNIGFDKIKDMILDVKDNFDILGIPERELGSTYDKIDFIKNLRDFMDANDIIKPIHILGCGKPKLILLLVAAGADIFDSNTWLLHPYNPNNLFSSCISDAEFKKCNCEGCRFEGTKSNPNAKLFLHNLIILNNVISKIKECMINHEIVGLLKRICVNKNKNLLNILMQEV